MKIGKGIGLIIAFSLLATATVSARAQGTKPDFVQKYEAEGVPSQSRKSEFDSTSGIPLPKQAKQTKQSESALVVKAQPLTEQEKQAFAAAVEVLSKSPDLAAKLGSDSRLLSGGELPKPRSGDGAPQYKFTYYNYKKDQAVEAYVAAGKVTRVRERELGYQPSVSYQELVEAVNIMMERVPEYVQKLNLDEMRGLAQSGPNGRREIHVFAAGNPAKPSVVVDLYTKKVVDIRQAGK